MSEITWAVGISCGMCSYTIIGNGIEGSEELMYLHYRNAHPHYQYMTTDGRIVRGS